MKGITPKQRAKSLTTILAKTYDPCGARARRARLITLRASEVR